MKIYQSKPKTIKLIGTWTGVEDEVTQWLTDNDYTWKIQVEDDESTQDRIKSEQQYQKASGEVTDIDTEPRTRLFVVGSRLWEQWQIDKGEALGLREDRDGQFRLHTTHQEILDADFDEVA